MRDGNRVQDSCNRLNWDAYDHLSCVTTTTVASGYGAPQYAIKHVTTTTCFGLQLNSHTSDKSLQDVWRLFHCHPH